MGLLDTLRSGVTIADKVTKPLQAWVQHSAYIGESGAGDPSYDVPVNRQAIISQREREMMGPNGQLVAIQATITFPYPIPPNGAPGRVEPVDSRDLFVLPDGTTGPIIDVSGTIDPATG